MALTAVVLGDNCIDRYLPPVGSEYIGGQAVNVASHLVALGLSVAYAGVVGTDPAGTRITTELIDRRVNVDLVERRQGSTGVTVIDVGATGDRRFVEEAYGVSAPYRPTAEALAASRRAQLVYAAHLDTVCSLRDEISPPATLALDWSDGDLSGLDATPDVLFVSRPGTSLPAGEELARQLATSIGCLVVLTLGRCGAAAASVAESCAIAAPAARVIDTLGAGDAFAAAFLAARMRGRPLAESMAEAAGRAADTCRHHGGYLSDSAASSTLPTS